MTERDGLLGPLDGRSVPLFVVAAGLMVITAGLFAAEVFMDRGMDTVLGLFAPPGFGVAFLGLLGLYPELVDEAPRLARLGAVALVLGVAGATVLLVSHFSELVGLFASQPAWATAANLPLLVGVVVGFGAFGIGGLRTDAYAGSIGLLMLWPAVVFGGIIFGSIVLSVTYPHWVHVGHSASEAAIYLGIAYLVRVGKTATDRADSPTASMAGEG